MSTGSEHPAGVMHQLFSVLAIITLRLFVHGLVNVQMRPRMVILGVACISHGVVMNNEVVSSRKIVLEEVTMSVLLPQATANMLVGE